MDSTGIQGLLRAQATVRQRGQQMILRNPSWMVRRVLDLANVIGLFTIEDEGN
jgi:anti-anti-sigma factor